MRTFIYRRLQENQNSNGLQIEGAYKIACSVVFKMATIGECRLERKRLQMPLELFSVRNTADLTPRSDEKRSFALPQPWSSNKHVSSGHSFRLTIVRKVKTTYLACDTNIFNFIFHTDSRKCAGKKGVNKLN